MWFDDSLVLWPKSFRRDYNVPGVSRRPVWKVHKYHINGLWGDILHPLKTVDVINFVFLQRLQC